jgi:hypothetical protein
MLRRSGAPALSPPRGSARANGATASTSAVNRGRPRGEVVGEMRSIVTALLAALALALGAGASATAASAQDLIEYALMAGVAADTGAQPGPDGAVSRAAGKTVELTDFTIDPTFINDYGEPMPLRPALDSRASYDRGDATGLDYAVSSLLGAAIDLGVDYAWERDVETGLDHFAEYALLCAGIDFWIDDSKVDVIPSG